MIDLFVVQASTFADDIDFVFLLVLVLVVFWGVLAEGVFFWLMWRYREREGNVARYVTGHEHDIKKFITIPHYAIIACDAVIIVAAVKTWYHVKQELPEPGSEIRVVAQQWAWSFQHPGPDNKLDTEDDIKTVDEVHVKADTVYHVRLEARDVLHSFSVPAFRLKQDAIPGRVITAWFEATRPGEYDLQCVEICGIGHGIMVAKLVVDTPEQHDAWMASKKP
jgi:cytochrome c oxidase subunit 2